MQSMTLRGPDEEPHPGLESQGRAASMPRLAAETQVSVLRAGEERCDKLARRVASLHKPHWVSFPGL